MFDLKVSMTFVWGRYFNCSWFMLGQKEPRSFQFVQEQRSLKGLTQMVAVRTESWFEVKEKTYAYSQDFFLKLNPFNSRTALYSGIIYFLLFLVFTWLLFMKSLLQWMIFWYFVVSVCHKKSLQCFFSPPPFVSLYVSHHVPLPVSEIQAPVW